MITLAACKPPPGNTSVSAADAGESPGVDASVEPRGRRVMRLVGGGHDAAVCVELEGGEIRCLAREFGQASLRPTFAASAWQGKPRVSSKLVEIGNEDGCLRYDNGQTKCVGVDETVDLQNVRSLAAMPLVLYDNGRTKFAFTDESEARRWQTVANTLTQIKSVRASAMAGCAQDESGGVRCWPDTSCMSSTKGALPLHTMRGAQSAKDIFVSGWHTLCVLNENDQVLCSAPIALETEICTTRGPHQRCGPMHLNENNLPGTLAGPGYDLCDAIGRPLVPVPNLSGVVRMEAFRHRTLFSQVDDSAFVSDIEDGGCAELPDGSISCFEPETCVKSRHPWTAARVQDLPSVRGGHWWLGADEGYATLSDGTFFTWPRRSGFDRKGCSFAPAARRIELPERIVDVVAGNVPCGEMPGWQRGACALGNSGGLWCWTIAERTHAPVKITRVAFDEH